MAFTTSAKNAGNRFHSTTNGGGRVIPVPLRENITLLVIQPEILDVVTCGPSLLEQDCPEERPTQCQRSLCFDTVLDCVHKTINYLLSWEFTGSGSPIVMACEVWDITSEASFSPLPLGKAMVIIRYSYNLYITYRDSTGVHTDLVPSGERDLWAEVCGEGCLDLKVKVECFAKAIGRWSPLLPYTGRGPCGAGFRSTQNNSCP